MSYHKIIAMEKEPTSVVGPDVLKENKQSVHAFLRDSYTHAKKQFQDGVNAFRDELREIGHTAGACFDFFALPVNNFLKDIRQIEEEFQEGPAEETSYPNIHIVPITEAISTAGPMEENY